MKKVDLTEEEEALILKNRQEKEDKNLKKVGYLKHDMYYIPDYGIGDIITEVKDIEEILVSSEYIDELLTNYRRYFHKIEKGTPFYYKRGRNASFWSSSSGGYYQDEEWAETNLERIKDFKEE